MFTSCYIKLLKILEKNIPSTKEIRLWALNLSNEIAQVIIASRHKKVISNFIKMMAEQNIIDEVYLITAIRFIEDNFSKKNFKSAFQVICYSNCLEKIVLAEKILDLTPAKAEALALFYSIGPTNDTLIDYILDCSDENKIKAICHVHKHGLDNNMINCYVERIKAAKNEKELEQIIATYNNYVRSIITFNTNIDLLPTSELIKALESSPDFHDQELTRQNLELALLRSNKCQLPTKK